MAQQAVDSLRTNNAPLSLSRQAPLGQTTAPTVGLRGGLGKTLLLAFLLLTIVPLSLLSFLIYDQIQQDAGLKLGDSLETIAVLKASRLVDWVASYERQLVLLARYPALKNADPAQRAELLAAQLAALQTTDATLTALIWIDEDSSQVVAVPESARTILRTLQPSSLDSRRLALVPGAGPGQSAALSDPVLAVGSAWDNQRLIGLLRWDSLRRIIVASDGQGEGVTTWLATADGLMASAAGIKPLNLGKGDQASEGVSSAMQGQTGSGAYPNLDGVPVFGAYRWIPDLQMALLVEYPQTEALASGNTLTAMVIGATLAVALLTAAIAAVVTRRLTRPIVQLTQTAAWMARGNLNQTVTINRRDEIGILARAFNRMAAELRVLYSELEAKVAERTQQLEEAHARTRYYVMQLFISAEVARIATSIRRVDELLTTATQLIGDAFELDRVSFYLLDADSQEITRQADRNGSDSLGQETGSVPSLIGQVAADGELRVMQGLASRQPGSGAAPPQATCEMAVPLRCQGTVLGVLYLQSNRPGGFDANDEMVYQSLADQIGIAIENARVYAIEQETVERLRELDLIQSQFLTNMSHALRTPLNSIMGFSRLMLRELDGPLTELQHTDLSTIYDSGRQLLGLINDMLELTQLEMGTAPFSLAEVDLAEIVDGVMATARALAMSKPVQLYQEVPDDLPALCTDGQRVRQVILALLSNAVKYTDEGSIHLLVTRDDGHVTISVRDTGIGIPPGERIQIFADPKHDDTGEGPATPGFGLAISRRVIEKLGGEIWVESKEGIGSTFTCTIPIKPDGAGLLSAASDEDAEHRRWPIESSQEQGQGS
jgi:signal transduction histidine kinase